MCEDPWRLCIAAAWGVFVASKHTLHLLPQIQLLATLTHLSFFWRGDNSIALISFLFLSSLIIILPAKFKTKHNQQRGRSTSRRQYLSALMNVLRHPSFLPNPSSLSPPFYIVSRFVDNHGSVSERQASRYPKRLFRRPKPGLVCFG